MANSRMIQSRINHGLSIAARKLGDSYQWYRPNGFGNPLAAGNLLGTITAAFANDKPLMFTAPSSYHSADTWYGFMSNMAGQNSGGGINPGDYFVGLQGTFFVTDTERFVTLHCVWTNRTINIGRPLDALGPGAQAYSGQSVLTADLTSLLTSWPVSLRIPGSTGRSRDAKMRLPSDGLEQFYSALLPPIGTPYPIQWNDIAVDDMGRRYIINGLEITPLGTRLSLEQWPT